jgi:hypothetical protein
MIVIHDPSVKAVAEQVIAPVPRGRGDWAARYCSLNFGASVAALEP